MSTTVTYKGSVIATISNTVKKLLTKGKYLEDDITITDSGGGGGANLTHGSKSVTPSETAYSGTEYPPTGYDGFDQFTVNVGAISSTYVGSGVSRQAAQTIHPSTSDQTIAADKYLTGAQTVKGVLLTNLTAENIKKDVVVEVGDSTDSDCVTAVTGTYEGSGSVQFKAGTVTVASDVSVPSAGVLFPNLQFPFQPDVVEIWMTKATFDALGTWVNNRFYHIYAAKKDYISPVYIGSAAGSDTNASANGYFFFRGTNVSATSANASGYGINGAFSVLNSTTYPNWEVNADGTVKVARFSSGSPKILAGTYRYVGYKFS